MPAEVVLIRLRVVAFTCYRVVTLFVILVVFSFPGQLFCLQNLPRLLNHLGLLLIVGQRQIVLRNKTLAPRFFRRDRTFSETAIQNWYLPVLVEASTAWILGFGVESQCKSSSGDWTVEVAIELVHCAGRLPEGRRNGYLDAKLHQR